MIISLTMTKGLIYRCEGEQKDYQLMKVQERLLRDDSPLNEMIKYCTSVEIYQRFRNVIWKNNLSLE